ncbi:hypothetical protein IWZ00DRAFT_247164 [Phyllosticta capitalensis]|uniref:mRNA export factor GLE1 n=1 Tax=Phyllosticta capitalensis TaxID=121624 RepID=A0ABR1YW30_9PEZI
MSKSPQPPRMSSSPFKNDSPSRQLFNEARQHVESNPADLDSPSRQLWREFSDMLIDGDRRFHNRLDMHEAAEQEKYRLLLAEAAKRHEQIRQSAERVAERVQLEEEQRRKRVEEEQKRELERIRQESARIEAEKRQRELDAVKRREEEQRKAAEHARQVQEAEERLRKQRANEEAEAARRKADKEEQDRKDAAAKETAAKEAAAREAAQAAARSQAQVAKPAQPSAFTQAPTTNGTTAKPSSSAPQVTSRPGIISSQQERDAVHNEYLEIHQRLKGLRRDFKKFFTTHPQLKEAASRIRRSMRMKIGQITHVAKPKGPAGAAAPANADQARGNKEKLRDVRELLLEAQRTPSPAIDVKPYLASATQARLPPGPFEISVLFLFELHHFCKSLINQFISDAGINASHADSLGILGVSILGNRDFCLMNQVPLSDILLAKLHHSCGVLFGIYGPENMQAGRKRLGWRCLHGDWETEQGHRERMTGIGGGWASLCLRKYRASTALIPPFTPAEYWTSFARIVDTPAAAAQPTHFNVLRAMTDGEFAGKFIDSFGRAGWAALRKGLVDFPQGHDHVAAKSLVPHVEEMKKSYMIALR